MIRARIGACAVVLALGGSAIDAQPAAPAPCAETPGFSTLDFWLGDWEVVDQEGTRQGVNRIEKILDGCAIFEHWTDVTGGEGKSLFYFDVLDETWHQVWVTQQATAPGGLKRKKLIEHLEGGAVRFQGEIELPDGRKYLDRTTLSPQADGTVRQHIQLSQDGGETWNEGWVGMYRRRE